MKQKRNHKKIQKSCLEIFSSERLLASRVKKTKRGFTLIESLVAIMIFSLVSVMIVSSFGSFYKNYLAAKKAQKSVESAQYAMNLMAKTIRTSEIQTLDNTTKLIQLYDNSGQNCVVYKYIGNPSYKLRYSSVNQPAGVGSCDWPTMNTNLVDLTPVNASGVGDIVGVSFNLSAGDPQLVTATLSVQGGPTAFPIQMSVSLRK